jgi:hypothetical protein
MGQAGVGRPVIADMGWCHLCLRKKRTESRENLRWNGSDWESNLGPLRWQALDLIHCATLTDIVQEKNSFLMEAWPFFVRRSKAHRPWNGAPGDLRIQHLLIEWVQMKCLFAWMFVAVNRMRLKHGISCLLMQQMLAVFFRVETRLESDLCCFKRRITAGTDGKANQFLCLSRCLGMVPTSAGWCGSAGVC